MQWSVVIKRAVEPDGTLLFAQRLTKEFLENARRTMGSRLYNNQYLNLVVGDEEKPFKNEWLRYYHTLPQTKYTFAFIDPAIGQKDHHDFTAIVVVDVNPNGDWFVRLASRYRLTPTQIVDKIFEIQAQFNCQGIGIEVVAYQEALLYILDERMRKKGVVLPVKGITRSKVSKETRILGLVPWFEWGRVLLQQGMTDLEDEYTSFPRASHDDILDALASIEEIAFVPTLEVAKLEKPHSPHDPNYEKWKIQNMIERAKYGEGSETG